MQEGKSAKVVAFVNQKGGVAKTTTAWNFGVELAVRGKDVCLLDMDPQGSLTYLSLVAVDDDSLTMSEWLGVKEKERPFADVVRRDIQKEIQIPQGAKRIAGRLDLVPTDIRFSLAERMLVGKVGGEQILARRIKEIKNQYDYIVIDAPPSLGMLAINVLVAATEIIIPTKPELISAEGLNLLFGTMSDIQDAYNKTIDIGGILLTMAKARTVGFRQVKDVLQNFVEEANIRIYDTVIRDSVSASDSAGSGLSIPQFKKDCAVAIDYTNWVDEYLQKEETL